MHFYNHDVTGRFSEKSVDLQHNHDASIYHLEHTVFTGDSESEVREFKILH